MNVYRFINSKDIREHLETIKYPFGSLEAAWIIYQCRFASLEEKHAAWRELIRTMPDCAIEERPNTEAHDSLHRFLAEYMERETKLLHAFCENDGGVYRWMECQEDGARFEHPGIYTDYAKCRNRISREIGDNEDGGIASYLVTKTYPDAEEPCMQSELSAAGTVFRFPHAVSKGRYRLGAEHAGLLQGPVCPDRGFRRGRGARPPAGRR